jgi:hypothetical protein
MVAWAYIEEEPPPLLNKPVPSNKKLPPLFQKETECNIILIMFIAGMVAISLMDSRK